MRRSELPGLRWLDLVHARVVLAQTRNGEGPIVYLNETASATLSGLPFTVTTRATDLLRSFTGEQVSMAFGRARKEVG